MITPVELDNFFDPYSATVIGMRAIRRENFERSPAPGDGELRALTAHVVFHDLLIFGTGPDYLAAVHPRLATLGERLALHLAATGTDVTGPDAETTIAIMPYPDPHGTTTGDPLPLSTRESRGSQVISAEELCATSAYYSRLMRTYGQVFGVVTNNGTVIGPDGGLLGAAVTIADALARKLTVVELGSGAGSTALVLARRGRLARYLGNDFSPEMVEHFRSAVAPGLDALAVHNEITLGSCLDTALPPADLVSVGVYYQAQPSFFAARGEELAACLGRSGVLVVQSGMLEDPFVTRLIAGDPAEHSAWPWYSPDFQLRRYFGWVGHFVVEQETILVATNSADTFRTISRAFDRTTTFRALSISAAS